MQLNTWDQDAGAAQVAWNLFVTYRARGHASWLAAGHKRSGDPDVLPLLPAGATSQRSASRQALSGRLARLQRRFPPIGYLRYWLGSLAGGRSSFEQALGRENFDFPRSRRVLQMASEAPDVLHGHNLHGGYFDLRRLPDLSRQVPLVLTLHDAWLLSGHCAHSFECARWQTGCGACPDLTIYPAVPRDATAYNWRRKAGIYRRSRLFVATPCRWLMEKVEGSMLAEGCVERRVIPNGVDLAVFRPGDRAQARQALDLPQDARILVFAARSLRASIWKDFATMRAAVARVAAAAEGQKLIFLALGEEAPAESIGTAELRFAGWQNSPAAVVRYYQAADLYLHAARADTFPNTVLEALACGIPAVATAVGGIPEQIVDGVTGRLVPVGDAETMARRVTQLLEDDEARLNMGAAAAADARRRFDLEDQATAYLDWYAAILERAGRGNARQGRP